MTMSIHGDRKVNPEDSEERDGARDSKRDENVGQCFKPKHQRQKTSQLINIFEKMAHMRMKIPQVAFMPQMAMDESQLIGLSFGKWKGDPVQSSTRWTDGRGCR